ncbi:TetR/AcrR family transcriptional regulator [Planomicrobium chinense]|uniref:TetR/AcrR family transcriptional regulator n=1 Tax=Planococcus chinensis TaxID=272917 RepID=UPI001CC53C91|nr:TetR/AcrR family transcriptional regulator [Planococcus chinensis]MBZ5202759.1 TetR/AcrR family transcriptional regulator [Planococcus chinensis]
MNLKKQQIINAAYTLFINKGYIASSIQDILDEAGVSKGTFYNYFASKAECLIAIMESIGSEIRQKRMAAAVGKPLDNSDVLAEQLCIRIQMNREKNLFSLYESIFYSQDEELKKFARETYSSEIEWIATRIVDVFGEESRPYALENAAVVHGSIQQLTNIWKLTASEELPTEQLSAFVIRRLKQAILNQMETKDQFITKSKILINTMDETMSLEDLSNRLKTLLLEEEEDIKQLVSFLADELVLENPRKPLIESVLSTLANNYSYENELVVALEKVWKELQHM